MQENAEQWEVSRFITLDEHDISFIQDKDICLKTVINKSTTVPSEK